MSTTKLAWGVGVATVAPNDAVLDVFFRKLGWGEVAPDEFLSSLPEAHTDPRRGVGIVPVNVSIDASAAPRDATDAYLRLHLMSHRLALPNSLNLDGIFGLLANVAWTSLGAVPIDQIDEVTFNMRRRGEHLTIHGVDKFPRMTDYVVPNGVRIADASRVRLGAHLAPGTTVMHEGFCNFNAGTLGTSMVEGRISAGVIVDDGSDIGAALRSWAHFRVAAKKLFVSASDVCSAPTVVLASVLATIALSKPAFMSPAALWSNFLTRQSSKLANFRAQIIYCSAATAKQARSKLLNEPALGAASTQPSTKTKPTRDAV